MIPRTIALDGSAASGKSTLGCALAKKLNYLYLDTGEMYRAITWAVLNAKINPNEEGAVCALAETVTLTITPPTHADGRQSTVLVNNTDVTWLIRSEEVTNNTSKVSSYPRVRQVLTRHQRTIAERGPVVMVGRDIGTVVLPNADLKIFTVAPVEVRARRRYREYVDRGQAVDFEQLMAAMMQRDKLDSEKPISPMIPAPDAVIINTDHLSREEVLQQVEKIMNDRGLEIRG